MATKTEGYFALLLHAHLPFVRHPEHERFLEESWFFEAVTETYLPLLIVMDNLVGSGVDFRVSWSLSPTLVSMLDDDLLRERYREHLERLIELSKKEVVRHRSDPPFRANAEFYADRFRLLQRFYDDVYGGDIVGGFRRLQEGGHVEVLTCAATHGFLPLLGAEPGSVRAQVTVAVEHYRERFGRPPEGIWLPECGYYPGLDQVLADAGLRYFCLETHGVLHGRTRARYGVHAPIVCPSGVAAFGRDPDCSKQVWSAEEGFPGHPDYREFYRDIGFDLPMRYVGPYVGPDDVRTHTGIKYHRITGPTEAKEPYERKMALARAAEHARRFARWREQQVEWLAPRMDRKPIVFAPYDAELFGHWWFEGPEWIHFLLQELVPGESSVVTATPSEYLAEYPEGQLSVPASSSWGHKGYYEVWLNDRNDWIYPRLRRASRAMSRLAAERGETRGLSGRALRQAGRELLLAQASDWAFILRTGTTTGYAERRIREHLENFERLASMLDSGAVDEAEVARLEKRHNIFPRIDPAVFRDTTVETTSRRDAVRHVAFLVAEMAPLVKVGGLGDVAGALPGALAELGLQVTVILPAYRSIDREKHGIRALRSDLTAPFGSSSRGFRLLEASRAPPGVRVLLVEDDDFFGRDGIYVDPETRADYPDNGVRFTFFTRAALESLRALGEPVDVVHSHDHQTALASAYIKVLYAEDPLLGDAATVYTLHNLGYQGIHDPGVLEFAGFGVGQCYPGSVFEYWGRVNFMKVGVSFADKVSTVSETYAREICEDETQSAGLAPVIRTRSEDLAGIPNGIDLDEWDPAKDPHLPAHYSAERIDGKRECKRALIGRTGLDDPEVVKPLIGVVTRLVDQKGLDLVEQAFDDMMARDIRLVVLGTGVPRYEEFLRQAASQNPGKVSVTIDFDNAFAHLIEAGSDMFLMPSLYEPCGLNQLYSLRYGTVPVVRATGGLADTVPDADERLDGVGFAFREYDPRRMLEALDRALAAFRDPVRWRGIQRRGMTRDLSWKASARRYIELYEAARASLLAV